jgi:hypothetical protein
VGPNSITDSRRQTAFGFSCHDVPQHLGLAGPEQVGWGWPQADPLRADAQAADDLGPQVGAQHGGHLGSRYA